MGADYFLVVMIYIMAPDNKQTLGVNLAPDNKQNWCKFVTIFNFSSFSV